MADHVLEAREEGVALKSQAVLFRAAHHSGPLEIELTRRNIPFVKFGGLKFLDSAHVKDVLAVLRFAENPKDRVAAFRVMQLIPGIGPSAAGNALEAMEGYKPLSAEAVVAAAPDVIVVSREGLEMAGGVEGVLAMPGVAMTPAGRAGRVEAFDAVFLLGFGPRLPEAVSALATALGR